MISTLIASTPMLAIGWGSCQNIASSAECNASDTAKNAMLGTDQDVRDVRRGTFVGGNRRQRERRGCAGAARARERNDVAEIGGFGLRRLIAARNQGDAVEVGAALVLRSRGDDVAWLRKLPHRHPFLEERVPEAHLQRTLERDAGTR